MRPGSLRCACGWRVGRSLVSALWRLAITKQEDRIRLVGILTWFVEQFGDVLFSGVIQDHVYKSLISGLRCRRNPPVYLASMLVLCPKVTIDQIAIIEDHNGLPPPVAGTGLDINPEQCGAILKVLADLRKQRTCIKNIRMGDKREETYSLPTKSLVLEGVYFHDPDFLPLLFKDMPNLHHIELQYNGTPSALQALSRHCKNLESLCFLEPRRKVSILEKDILPILFGIPPPPFLGFPIDLLSKFVEEKEFREKFTPQFPNLKKLDLDELYFEEYTLHDVYTLVLVLHPKLSGFGKHTGLTSRILLKYRQLWSIVNNGSECQINLTKAKFVDSASILPPNDPELELRYLEDVVPMFRTLKSVELQKSNWNETEVAKFCQMFTNRVDALSLNVLPVNEISCLSNITHLRLTYMRQYSFDQVHLTLDNCLNLKTLSFHPVFQEHTPANHERGEDLEHLGRMRDEDQHFIEHLLVDEIVQEMPDLRVFQGEINEDLGAIGGAPVPPRPPPRYNRISKPKFKIHHKLTTLRIASLFDAAREPSEIFLQSLLERLPNLHNLCLGMWMGSLSKRRRYLTCTGNVLVSVVTGQRNTKPLLTHLEQLCCLPSGTEHEMCRLLARLTKSLPCLHTIVVPALDKIVLTPTLRYFQHTSIEIQHKCATDQVFTYWEPEH